MKKGEPTSIRQYENKSPLLEVYDPKFVLSKSHVENEFKTMFEKGQQSVHVKPFALFDAVLGAFISSIVSAVNFFLTPDKKPILQTIVTYTQPLIFLVMLIVINHLNRQKRKIAQADTTIRDQEVSDALTRLEERSKPA